MAKKAAKKKGVGRRGIQALPENYDGSIPLPEIRQETFCQLYASNTTHFFFGHGQNSYAGAYGQQKRIDELEEKIIGARFTTGRGKKWKLSEVDTIRREIKRIKATCQSSASDLLLFPKISARVNYLFDSIAADFADIELAYVIRQRRDLASKVAAITHYDKKRGKIEDKLKLTVLEPITKINYVSPEAK